MNKKFIATGLIIILICVGLSGCNEESKEDVSKSLKSVTVILEAIAQVVNSSGEPVENVSVTFVVEVNGAIHSSLVRTTDSTGWTSFAVADFLLPLKGTAVLTVGITETLIINKYSLDYQYTSTNKVNNAYYWSISARIVEE
jgi:hypothetical protein